jgi:HK97 family phage major capsid protein
MYLGVTMKNATVPTAAEFAAWRETHPPMAGGDPAAPDKLAELTEKLNGLTSTAGDLAARLENASADSAVVAEVKALMDGTDDRPGLRQQIEVLTAEREAAMREAEVKAMGAKLTTLNEAINSLKEGMRLPDGEFRLPSEGGSKAVSEDLGSYGPDSGFTVFNDIRMANKGDAEARKRLIEGFEGAVFEGKALNSEGKAMSEGVAAQGGYLVRPQIERQIVIAREFDNVLRGICSSLNVTSNAIQLDQIGLTTTAGWVEELLTKPEGTGMTLATITASVFTAAGLATISNQLLADSNPAVDGLVTADLAKRLVALEETAFLNGSGTGQPLGILNTPGVTATTLTTTPILDLLDAILDSIAKVETAHGAPSAILMHPRTWTRILKARDVQGAYYIDPTGGPQDPRTGLRGPVKTLWGYPVLTTNRMPTNKGAGTNESRIIVGDFREALILDRQGITVDESKHVHFTTNQTVFRSEMRVGFTAARTPTAFDVIGGAGLANG